MLRIFVGTGGVGVEMEKVGAVPHFRMKVVCVPFTKGRKNVFFFVFHSARKKQLWDRTSK